MIINIELSDEELSLLTQKAGGIRLDDYFRSILFEDSDTETFIRNTLLKHTYLEKRKLYDLYRQHRKDNNKASMSYRNFNSIVYSLAYTVRPGIEGRPLCWKLKSYS